MAKKDQARKINAKNDEAHERQSRNCVLNVRRKLQKKNTIKKIPT